MSAQAGVGIFVSPRLTHCITDWIPIRERVCLFKLRLLEQSLCILQVYAPNAKTQYQPFLDEVGAALQRVTSAESIVLLGDFNAHMGTDNKSWKGVIKRISNINRNGRSLLQFCATNGLCIMNTFFSTRRFRSTPGTEIQWDSVLSLISVLLQWPFFSVVNVCVKRGAELSTDHHLVVCILRGPNHP